MNGWMDEWIDGDEFYTPEEDEESCTTTGSLVAESLSYDPHRVDSLARLAVAFSPLERALYNWTRSKRLTFCVSNGIVYFYGLLFAKMVDALVYPYRWFSPKLVMMVKPTTGRCSKDVS
jgi:hypothetical protein